MMKKQKLWMNILSNLAMVSLTFSVALVCFMPSDAVATSGEDRLFRSGDSNDGVSLMFNVYWGADEVYQILDVLDEYEAKSTFFIGGSWADDHVECLKEIASRGHEIGNHGYFHKQHDKLSEKENREEILHCNQFVSLAIGSVPMLFAPPSGAYSEATLSAVSHLQMYTVLWTKDTIDWRDKDPSLVYTRATKGVEAGALVLMHPMPHTVKALPDILKEYKRRGLSAITVGENLRIGG
jgi:peptidoglycan/xylan/chitin deacetylase (PgdA/CDA1 family)